MSIGMSPFKALYGYDATSFVDLILTRSRAPSAKDFIQQSNNILEALKENLREAQRQQKLYAHKHQTERAFEEGNMVFLRLQSFRQSSMKGNEKEKLKPHFYGPYQVIKKVEQVAYELELPRNSKIQNTFHVACLKEALRQQINPSMELPPLDYEGKLILEPESVLDVREKRLRNKAIPKYLIKWKRLPPEDATWERIEIFEHPNLKLFEVKQLGDGSTMMNP